MKEIGCFCEPQSNEANSSTVGRLEYIFPLLIVILVILLLRGTNGREGSRK